MKLNLLTCSLSIAILSLASGSVWSQQQNATDCSNAQEDIAHLKHEKKSTDERTVKGVMSILPIGLVVNAASSHPKHDPKEEMEINEYNQRITDRINDIKKNCNIQDSNSVSNDPTD